MSFCRIAGSSLSRLIPYVMDIRPLTAVLVALSSSTRR